MLKSQQGSSKPVPSYKEEESLLNQGFSFIAGLDEVGRGPIAGPVLAAALILPSRPTGEWVNMIRDSKALTQKQRERVMPHLLSEAVAVETGACSSQEIDQIGIALATRLAMQRAVKLLRVRPDFLLLDAFPVPEIEIPQKAIIKGDALCLSIAAASIVAKVARDQIMIEYDAKYPGYGFSDHKGYPTVKHLNNLKTLGPLLIHRYTFSPVTEYPRPNP